MNTKDFGQLIYQSERQTLDFVKKYNKLTLPLVLVVVAILFLNPGIVDWILESAGIMEFTGSFEEYGIPSVALWIFLGLSVIYLVFRIIKINKFKGFQLSVYQKGAVLELVKKTEIFNFDEFKRAEFSATMKHTKYREWFAFIYLIDRAIEIEEKDVPEAAFFVDVLSAAYAGYVIDRMRSQGVNGISVDFGHGMKMENGFIVDASKKMLLSNIKSVEIGHKDYRISGILENGKEADFYWSFKHLHNAELFSRVISEFTSIEEITSPPPPVIEFNEAFLSSDEMRDFEQKHSLPIEKEDCLAFSAILALSNHDSPKVFAIQWLPKFIVKKGLKNMWGVTDRQTALNTLAGLASAAVSAPRANEIYKSIRETGEASAIYKQAKENLLKLGVTENEINKINSLNAWDYGRAGFIARNAAFCGFIKEEETWEYLKQAAQNAGKEYGSWKEYLCAYVLGRAAAFNNSSDDICQILKYLLKDESKDRLFM